MIERVEAKGGAETAADQGSPEPGAAGPGPTTGKPGPSHDWAERAEAFLQSRRSEAEKAEEEEETFVRMVETMTASLRSLANRADQPPGTRRGDADAMSRWPNLAKLLKQPAGEKPGGAVESGEEPLRSESAAGAASTGEPAAGPSLPQPSVDAAVPPAAIKPFEEGTVTPMSSAAASSKEPTAGTALADLTATEAAAPPEPAADSSHDATNALAEDAASAAPSGPPADEAATDDRQIEEPRGEAGPGPSDAAEPASSGRREAGSSADAVAPQEPPAGSRTLLGPGDDPGDLFASTSHAPRPVAVRPAMPAVAPLDLNDLVEGAEIAAPPPAHPSSAAARTASEGPAEEAPEETATGAVKETVNETAVEFTGNRANAPAKQSDAVALSAAVPSPPPPRTARKQAPDPLAPLRALSEEEITALFS